MTIVKTCKHVTPDWTDNTPVFCCDNCYQPKHAKSPTYYRVRTLVRFVVQTVLFLGIIGLGIAGIWVLAAVL